MPTRRRRNRAESPIQRRIARTVGTDRTRVSNARRTARRDRAAATLSNAVGRRYVNDPNGRYGSRAVYSRRTGARVGTMVGMAH